MNSSISQSPLPLSWSQVLVLYQFSPELNQTFRWGCGRLITYAKLKEL